MTTWMEVMALARALRDKRAAGTPLDGRDAERLLQLLFAFHECAVESTPAPDPAPPRAPSAS